MVIEQRMNQLGIELPEPSKPGANYVPVIRVADVIYLSAQLSQWNGQ